MSLLQFFYELRLLRLQPLGLLLKIIDLALKQVFVCSFVFEGLEFALVEVILSLRLCLELLISEEHGSLVFLHFMHHEFAVIFFALFLNFLLEIENALVLLKVEALDPLRPPHFLFLFEHDYLSILLFLLFLLTHEVDFLLESDVILFFDFSQLPRFAGSLNYFLLGSHHLGLE